MRMKSPTVTITTAITERCCTGRMTRPVMSMPRTNEIDEGEENATQYERPHWMSW